MSKRALITGASEGIGEELAKVFARNGYDLILVARNNNKLDTLKNELSKYYGIDVKVVCIDLTKQSSAENLYSAISHVRVDVLINNAGMGSYGEFYKSDLKTEEDIIMLNVLSLCKLTHIYANQMVEQGGGTIINMASTASFQPGPLMSNYYASKAYVLSFTEALAKELSKQNIKVMAYCPGPTRTSFLKKANVSEEILTNESMKTAREVALDIFKKAHTNYKKSVRIYGKRYKFAIFGEKFLPRKTTTNIIYNIQKKRSKNYK